MRKVSVFSLKPGYKVGRTIYNSVGGILLNKGVILTDRYIRRLIHLGIPFVYVNDGISDVEVDDIITQETRVAAVKQVKRILLEAKESGSLVIKPSLLYDQVSNITKELLAKKSLMLNMIDLRAQDDYTFAHSVNVCVLALMTGISLGFTRDQLAVLGVGALLHDVGKVHIPDEILNKPGKLTEEEFFIMKKHTNYGYEMIRLAKGLGQEPPIIAYQHHESYDGSGYPMGIKGDQFHEFAQIVAIADKFDALTANRIYRKAYPSHEAYEMCAASGDYLFKDYIVKAFLHNVAAYSSGELVQLNNGYIARVIDTPKGYALFPRLKLLLDHRGRPVNTPKEIALADVEDLCIVKVLNEEEAHLLLNKLNG